MVSHRAAWRPQVEQQYFGIVNAERFTRFTCSKLAKLSVRSQTLALVEYRLLLYLDLKRKMRKPVETSVGRMFRRRDVLTSCLPAAADAVVECVGRRLLMDSRCWCRLKKKSRRSRLLPLHFSPGWKWREGVLVARRDLFDCVSAWLCQSSSRWRLLATASQLVVRVAGGLMVTLVWVRPVTDAVTAYRGVSGHFLVAVAARARALFPG